MFLKAFLELQLLDMQDYFYKNREKRILSLTNTSNVFMAHRDIRMIVFPQVRTSKT